jgi:hypothetical protein
MELPIFHNPSLAMSLMNRTGTHDDDDEIQAAVAWRFDAKEALAKARQAHTRAARVGPAFPPEDLARLKARVTAAEREADRIVTRLREAAAERLRRARRTRTEALQQALARPSNVDPVSDRLDQADRRRHLEAEPLETRTLMLVDAAKQGTHADLVRAALTAEPPPFQTKSWQPLLPDETAQELREWVMARRAPETIADIRAAWRLTRLADDLAIDRAGGTTPAPPRTPTSSAP